MNWKTLIFTFILSYHCFQSVAQNQVPQLQAGIPVDTVIYNFTYFFDGGCTPNYDLILTIDQNILPLVSGVNYYGVISGLGTQLDSVYTDELGYLHNGDTIWFSQSSPQYTFYYPLPASISIDVHLAGTPLTAFESYPCQLIMNCTLALCLNTCQINAFNAPPFQCLVNEFNSLETVDNIAICQFFPNPASNILNIHFSNNDILQVNLKLYNSFGQLVIELNDVNTIRNRNINISTLASGIYYFVVSNDKRILKKEKLVIQ